MKVKPVSVVENSLLNAAPEHADIRQIPLNQWLREGLIGTSSWAQKAREAIVAHAAHDYPILLHGEFGTGKELVAWLIHRCSARGQAPFVTLSCNDMTMLSLEAALFGWVRELPSGRNRLQRGLVEAARGGTLYISEISKVSESLQPRLARLIQYQEFRRLGDPVLEAADVRVLLGWSDVSWTQGDPPALRTWAVADAMSIPPLRQRKADIEPLSRQFVKQVCQRTGRELRELIPDTLNVLRRYDWPGNVEELKQVIEVLVYKSKPPRLDPSLIPPHIGKSPYGDDHLIPAASTDLGKELKQFERLLVCAALKQSQGNQAKAAQLLGLKPTTLNAKLARLGVDAAGFRE